MRRRGRGEKDENSQVQPGRTACSARRVALGVAIVERSAAHTGPKRYLRGTGAAECGARACGWALRGYDGRIEGRVGVLAAALAARGDGPEDDETPRTSEGEDDVHGGGDLECLELKVEATRGAVLGFLDDVPLIRGEEGELVAKSQLHELGVVQHGAHVAGGGPAGHECDRKVDERGAWRGARVPDVVGMAWRGEGGAEALGEPPLRCKEGVDFDGETHAGHAEDSGPHEPEEGGVGGEWGGRQGRR